MRNTLLVLAMALLFGAAAQASQPVTIGFTMLTPPYERWGVSAALPLGEHVQVFVEFQGEPQMGVGNKYPERYGGGVKVFPGQPMVYVGVGAWSPDGWRFDEDNERYDVHGGFTWIVGLRIFAEAGATADLRYDGFGGYSAGLGLSF